MKKFSFIHCSDLHLGCQQFNEPQRTEDFRDTFSYIVDYAIEKNVDAVFIGGDLFHHRNVNAPTLTMAVEQLGRLKDNGIDVMAIEGNHDKALYLEMDSWMSFLNRHGYIKLLRPDFSEGRLTLAHYDGRTGCAIENDNLRVIGLGYLGATTRQRLEEASLQLEASDKFTVVLLHAAVDKLLGQDMAGVGKASFDAFKGKVDYFALGHIHSRQESDDFIYNPGAPESVHADETRKGQEKGFYYVCVEDNVKCVNFIPSKRREFCRFDVDVTNSDSPQAVLEKVIEVLTEADLYLTSMPVIIVNIYGMLEFSSLSIDTSIVTEKIRESFPCLAVEVQNNTNLAGAEGGQEYDSLDRLSIEKHVLTCMVEELPGLRELGAGVAELVLKVKNCSLGNVSDDEIISLIEQVMVDMPEAEAAVMAEEDGRDENQEG